MRHHPTLYIQMLGRGTHLSPGKIDCLILDVVGASTRHALLTSAVLCDVDSAALAQLPRTAAVAARPHHPLAFTRGMAADVLTAVMGDWE